MKKFYLNAIFKDKIEEFSVQSGRKIDKKGKENIIKEIEGQGALLLARCGAELQERRT